MVGQAAKYHVFPQPAAAFFQQPAADFTPASLSDLQLAAYNSCRFYRSSSCLIPRRSRVPFGGAQHLSGLAFLMLLPEFERDLVCTCPYSSAKARLSI